MATRNTLTSARPMKSGPWAFCESIIYRQISFCKKNIGRFFAKIWRTFSLNLAKEGLPLKVRWPKLLTCYVYMPRS